MDYWLNAKSINKRFLLAKATPNGCLVSGPSDFQIRMRADGFSHYIIMILCTKYLLYCIR